MRFDGLYKAMAWLSERTDNVELRAEHYYQAIDNVLSVLISQKNGKIEKNHGRKIETFEKMYVKTKKFSSRRLPLLKDVEDWMRARYARNPQVPKPAFDFQELRQLSDALLNLAIEIIAKEKKSDPHMVLAMIDDHARRTASQSIASWNPTLVPGTFRLESFKFLERIRDECLQRGLISEHEIGFISGLARAEVFGLPAKPERALTKFEREVFLATLNDLRRHYQNLCGLSQQVAFRNETGVLEKSEELRRRLALDYLIGTLYFVMEDVDISGLPNLFSQWNVILNQIKTISEAPANRFIHANSKVAKWFRAHKQMFTERDEKFSEWSDEFFIDSWRDPSKEDRLNRVAVLLTVSPRATEAFGGRIENLFEDEWRAIPIKKISHLLALEAAGQDIYELQPEMGGYVPGLRFFAHMMRGGLTSEQEKRLRNWRWFTKRAGLDGVKRLKGYIEEERHKTNSTN